MDTIQVPSPLFGFPQGHHGRNGQSIKGLVYHTMDGWWAYYKRIIAGEVSIENSANYSINVDGAIHQHVADGDAAWCNGPMDHPDLTVPFIKTCWEDHINPNLVTISVELEGRSGDPLPDPQYAALVWWTEEMMRRHPQLTPDRQHLVKHHQIYYPKSCPGPAFPYTQLLADVQPVVVEPPPPVVEPPVEPPVVSGYTADTPVVNAKTGKQEPLGAAFAAFLNADKTLGAIRFVADVATSGSTHDRALYIARNTAHPKGPIIHWRKSLNACRLVW